LTLSKSALRRLPLLSVQRTAGAKTVALQHEALDLQIVVGPGDLEMSPLAPMPLPLDQPIHGRSSRAFARSSETACRSLSMRFSSTLIVPSMMSERPGRIFSR
jgi:hypothetical protein